MKTTERDGDVSMVPFHALFGTGTCGPMCCVNAVLLCLLVLMVIPVDVFCSPRGTPSSAVDLKKYHLCLSIATNSLWEALKVKARSPNKFMNVSDTQVSDEDGYMSRKLTITANSKIVNVRIWINPVISKIVIQPLHSDTDMSKNSINGVETIVRDGRGSNITLAPVRAVFCSHVRALGVTACAHRCSVRD